MEATVGQEAAAAGEASLGAGAARCFQGSEQVHEALAIVALLEMRLKVGSDNSLAG